MQGEEFKATRIRKLYKSIRSIYRKLLIRRGRINIFMKERYSPGKIAFFASLAAGMIMVALLFIPPNKGVADDGSLYRVLQHAGLSYAETNPEDIYNNYFIKKYRIETASLGTGKLKNSQDIFVKGAILIDTLLTRDQYFDIRFLALLYYLLYIPAIYLLIKYACRGIYYFSEAVTVAALSVFIFADISYVCYFNSLYPEALWSICSLYFLAAILRMNNRKCSYLSLFLIGVFGSLLCLSRKQCSVIGFILAGFCIAAFFYYRSFKWKASCIFLSIFLSAAAMFAYYSMEEDFNLTSKYHAMTRGVLFEAPNPEAALREFGINPSFAILAKTSAYNPYPFVEVDNEQLKKEFYDQYKTKDVVIYYMKHPVLFLRMLDVAVKNMASLRRSYCGNYEKSAGMPKMAQGFFWSGWSNFKVRFAPGTVGYLLVLNFAAFLLNYYYKRSKSSLAEERVNSLLTFPVMVTLMGLSQAAIAIVKSGDAELAQHTFLLGSSLDLLVFFISTQWITRLKIFRMEDEKVVKAKCLS